ncbi:ferritin-like domain-containing protein [Acidicapsa ligni]|uniref:ferritin-like domain-containing protein n=1 Tax=Acidicapsa ligni TaxID=542300 RepID=UPI0021DFEA64|nr:ferritin-like domain-containing protein [Acidicapsa ligni]
MATTETQILDEVIVTSRRRMMMMGGSALAGIVLAATTSKSANAQATLTDADYLNFALNLEYLEAEYYTLASTGMTIDQVGLGIGAGTATTGGGTVTVKPGGFTSCKVPFSDPVNASYAMEIASEEQKHVTFLRGALGASAVAQPNIDLFNSFNAAASAAGIGAAFDPFASDVAFLLGSYIFEDVGVTAYHGAAGSLTDAGNLTAAAGILAVEAYHAGLIRTILWGMDQANPGAGIAATATKISNLRATLDGTGNDDIGLTTTQDALNGSSATFTASTIVNADSNSIAFSRTAQQVLNIVYASPSGTKGGFFPNGLNGKVS